MDVCNANGGESERYGEGNGDSNVDRGAFPIVVAMTDGLPSVFSTCRTAQVPGSDIEGRDKISKVWRGVSF